MCRVCAHFPCPNREATQQQCTRIVPVRRKALKTPVKRIASTRQNVTRPRRKYIPKGKKVPQRKKYTCSKANVPRTGLQEGQIYVSTSNSRDHLTPLTPFSSAPDSSASKHKTPSVQARHTLIRPVVFLPCNMPLGCVHAYAHPIAIHPLRTPSSRRKHASKPSHAADPTHEGNYRYAFLRVYPFLAIAQN